MNIGDLLPALSLVGIVASVCVLLDHKIGKEEREREITRHQTARRLWFTLYTEAADELAVHQEREKRRQRGLKKPKVKA